MKSFKRITKRGLSLFVALLMCMSVMSLTAFAEDEVTTDPVETIEQVTEPAGETQDPVEVVEPVEDEIPAEDPAPVEDEAPAEDPAPVEDEAPAEDPAPVEDETPVEAVTVPTITALSVSATGATSTTDANGNQTMSIPGNTLLSDCTFTLTASEAVTFSAPSVLNTGDLYVSGTGVNENGENYVALNFNVFVEDPYGSAPAVDLNDSQYSLVLTSTDRITWTGGFDNATMTVDGLAALLPGGEATVPSGTMNGTSQARVLLANRDASTTMLVLCAPEAAVYTLTFTVDGASQYVWKLPAGYTLTAETLPTVPSGYDGWCTSNSFEDATPITSITVVADQPLYAKPTAAEATFLEKLQAGQNVAITSDEEWETFAANTTGTQIGQLVTLEKDIDCGNKTYDPIIFKGSFNGGNHTISNATFREVASSYNSSSESDIYCSGMFASIGPGQIIANLKLNNITAQSSRTYAGILAGLVDGSGSNPALIRNIQVTNGTATGRSAAGITGFLRNATVIYCSSRGTTITGIANGGGIVGINNAVVSNCYSTTTPSAVTFLGGKAGGITGKNVRGGRLETCWTTMATAVGGYDSAAEGTQVFKGVNADTTVDDFIDAGFDTAVWILDDGASTDFDADEIIYNFTSNS